jgi:hypothetical protein
MTLLPGWLYHCVLPLVLPPPSADADGGSSSSGAAAGAQATVRISAAFNVVFEGHEPKEAAKE